MKSIRLVYFSLLSLLMLCALMVFASPSYAKNTKENPACAKNTAIASHNKNCPVADGFVHDLATDTLTVNYGGLGDVLLFSVTMRIPGYEEYTSGVWVGANVWNPTSSNCVSMMPYCNYNMDVTWENNQVVVKNIDDSYQGSRVVQIDFYDQNFNLLHTMGGYTAY